MEVKKIIIQLKFSARQMKFGRHGFFELPCFHFSCCLNVSVCVGCVCVYVCVCGLVRL